MDVMTNSLINNLQAYGYKNYKRVGVILQRGVFNDKGLSAHIAWFNSCLCAGILILGLVFFPIVALWLNTESLLLLLQQPPCVARWVLSDGRCHAVQ